MRYHHRMMNLNRMRYPYRTRINRKKYYKGSGKEHNKFQELQDDIRINIKYEFTELDEEHKEIIRTLQRKLLSLDIPPALKLYTKLKAEIDNADPSENLGNIHEELLGLELTLVPFEIELISIQKGYEELITMDLERLNLGFGCKDEESSEFEDSSESDDEFLSGSGNKNDDLLTLGIIGLCGYLVYKYF